MANPKNKKCSKKSLAAVPHKDSLGEVWRLYRITMAWLRHLSAALRQAFARAGAAVASSTALVVNKNRVVGHGVPWTRERVEGSGDYIAVSAPAYEVTDSAPPLAPSPATRPRPTGAKNGSSTPPPPTGAKNRSSTPPLPTGAKNCTSGSEASCSASATASNSRDPAPRSPPKLTTSSPPTVAENTVSQASGDFIAVSSPAYKPSHSSPRLAPSPATQPPPTAAKNRSSTPPPPTGTKNCTSGSQASCSASAAASKSRDSAPRPPPKLTISSPPTVAENSFSGLNKKEPFSDGYHLNSLFEEDGCFVLDEYVLIYARFCSKRAASLANKREICHICYFEHGKVITFKKEEFEKHCSSMHKNGVFLCEKKGCFMRTSSVGDAGRHHYFCHEQHNEWWIQYIKLHGEV